MSEVDAAIQNAYLTLTWIGAVAVAGGLGTLLLTVVVASPNPSRILKPLAWLMCAALLVMMMAGLGGCGLTVRDLERREQAKLKADECRKDAYDKDGNVDEALWKYCDKIEHDW